MDLEKSKLRDQLAAIDGTLADGHYYFNFTSIGALCVALGVAFILGYVYASGDFGSRYFQVLRAYYVVNWSHRDVGWDIQRFSFLGRSAPG